MHPSSLLYRTFRTDTLATEGVSREPRDLTLRRSASGVSFARARTYGKGFDFFGSIKFDRVNATGTGQKNRRVCLRARTAVGLPPSLVYNFQLHRTSMGEDRGNRAVVGLTRSALYESNRVPEPAEQTHRACGRSNCLRDCRSPTGIRCHKSLLALQ